MLEHVRHGYEVRAESVRAETSSAGSAGDVVPSDDFESAGCGSH